MKYISYRKIAAGLLLAFASLGITAAADSQLSELRLLRGTDNLIEFNPSTTSYSVKLERPTDIVISAAPADGKGIVSITCDGTEYHNHCIASIDANTRQIGVSVSNGSDKTEYTIDFSIDGLLVDDPRQLSIYQIMPACFMREETGVPGFTDFWGPAGHRTDGNFKGITASLDYIKGLGFNAIWLTPIYDTRGGRGGEKLQATGYTTTDFFTVDPRFGTPEEFRELVNEAHKRDIYIILDINIGNFGLDEPLTSPNGNSMVVVPGTPNVRGDETWYGNISYPGSLEFFKEVFRYWMEEYEVDGWRLDVAYQEVQGGHNYWKEIRQEVELVAAERAARGEVWGTFGYMVGEDWTSPQNVTVTHDDGLRSVFDFEGRDHLINIGGDMNHVKWLFSDPASRGYDPGVIPNLFIGNHDMTRIGNIFPDVQRLFFQYAVMAAYSGPVTLLYNDEFGVKNGVGNPDNQNRVSGRTAPETDNERWLYENTRKLFNLRAQNPAMWRGEYDIQNVGNVCRLTKTDSLTGQNVVMLLPINYNNWTFSTPVTDLISGQTYSGTVQLKPFTPVIYSTSNN